MDNEAVQDTGLRDSDGIPITIGCKVRKPCGCNQELHGSWAEHDVVLRGLIPVLLYNHSEKGQILPKGYTGCFLSDEYDVKNLLFVTDISTIRPMDEMLVVKSMEIPVTYNGQNVGNVTEFNKDTGEMTAELDINKDLGEALKEKIVKAAPISVSCRFDATEVSMAPVEGLCCALHDGQQVDEPCTCDEVTKEKTSMEQIIAVRNAILAIHGKEIPKEFIEDKMECPLCGKQRHYTISAYNGHIHSSCVDKNCLHWIE